MVSSISSFIQALSPTKTSQTILEKGGNRQTNSVVQIKLEPLPAAALAFPSKVNNVVQGVQGPKYFVDTSLLKNVDEIA